MRYLAVARYRLLTTIRSASWVFGISAFAALMFLGSSGFTNRETYFLASAEVDLARSAIMALFCYVWHTLILVAACNVFGTGRRNSEAAETSDLIDTAPLTPANRFWGDALGIFAAGMIIHLCTLPLLALVMALSPFAVSTFLGLELAFVAIVVIVSTAESWELHARRSSWSRTRSVRSEALFLLLLILTLIFSTRWEAFRDALGSLALEPSARSWTQVIATVDSPPLLLVSLLILYAGFIAFFHLNAVRSLERR